MDYEKNVCPVLNVDGILATGKQFDLEITLPEDNRSVIYGIVKDCYKDPVENAVVKLVEVVCEYGKEERRPVSHTFTDKNGEFVFGPLCANRFYEIEIWVDFVKHCKVCTKCEHEGKCLKGIKIDCHDKEKDCKHDKYDKYEKDEKYEKYEKYDKDEKYDKYEKYEKDEECDKYEKYEKDEKDEKCDKCDKYDKDEKYDKCDKCDKDEKYEKDDEYGKDEKHDKCDKCDKDEKHDKCDKCDKDEKHDKCDKCDKDEKHDKCDKCDKDEKYDKCDKCDKDEKYEKYDKYNRPYCRPCDNRRPY